MEWQFINKHILKEKNTGYTLSLISGTWKNPEEIKTDLMKGPQPIRHSELLRRGLEYAYDWYDERQFS
ncbi:MAG: hypothetical protein AAFZ92_02500 [Pseudomonadota bacterium]